MELKKNAWNSKFQKERFVLEAIFQSLQIFPSVLIPLITEYIVSSSILIAVGGYNLKDCRGDIQTCEFFNFGKYQWEYFSKLHKPQKGAFLHQVKHKLFLIGGKGSEGGSGARFCYECNLSSEDFFWKEKKRMFASRIFPFGFSYENEIFIFGGYTFERNQERRHVSGEKYNLLTNTWTRLSSLLPTKELYSALAILIFKSDTPIVYAFGQQNPLAFLGKYDLHTDTWTRTNLSALQKEDFKSGSEHIFYHSNLGIYFNYPYFYTTQSGNVKKYNIVENNCKTFVRNGTGRFIRNVTGRGYYTMLLPNKENFSNNGEILLFDWDGEVKRLNVETEKLQVFPRLPKSQYACTWIDLI